MYKPFELLNEYAGSEEARRTLLRHGSELAQKCLAVVERKNLYDQLDWELVMAGCYLHDIGTYKFLESKDHIDGYLMHGIIGGEILRSKGLESLARIAERHIGAGISREDIESQHMPLPPQDFLPESLEEKLVCYADKFSSKSRKAKDLESIRAELATYGEGPQRRWEALEELFG